MRDNRRFTKFHGVFTCELCGKRTRQTGRHEYANQDCCDDCIDLQEHENAINDNAGYWSEEHMKREVFEQKKMQKAFEERLAKHKPSKPEPAGTIDLEPTWAGLCRIASRGAINAEELMPACKIADLVRQAQKAGKAEITFDLSSKAIKVRA